MKVAFNSLFCIAFIIFLILDIKHNKRDIIQLEEMGDRFSDIYKNHKWVRGSGRGSDRECTNEYRSFLKRILEDYKIKTIIDYGCGDWKMLSAFSFDESQTYYGYDVVESVINTNKERFSKENIIFFHIKDSLEALRQGEMIMIKDVFQHWSNYNIINFIKNILPKYKYSLITNTYNYTGNNRDIEIGKCRSLDLEEYPFNMKFIIKKDMYFCSELKRIYLYKS